MAKKTTKATEVKATAKKTEKATEPKTTKKTAPKKTEASAKDTTKKSTPKTAPKKTAQVETPKKNYVNIKKLETMKGGDRIFPKNNKDNWFMKIPSGVYEGRFESHATGEVIKAEKLVDMLADIECTVSKRKALLLESFYKKKADQYIIDSKYMEQCWVEVMKKLEKGKDKDGARFYLYVDGDNYILEELELDF